MSRSPLRCPRGARPWRLMLVAGGVVFLAGCGAGPSIRGIEEARELRFWLENMVWHHRFSSDEVAAVLETSRVEAEEILAEHDVRESNRPDPASEGALRVLPYPGGRHPRIGFLDGAIDPHRGTKFSIFLPGKDAGYAVVDLPEALWWVDENGERELLYLAHTHIPTRWDKKKILLERMDWSRGKDGRLESERRLPNGIEFRASVVPEDEKVRMRLAMKNGTGRKITGLRTQICVMLKGAPDFNEQTDENKVIEGFGVATRSKGADRWIVTTWDRARPWQNPRVPCMHSDPAFPDLAPGESAVVDGEIRLWEGEDVRAHLHELQSTANGNDAK